MGGPPPGVTISKWNLVHFLNKRKLLIAINTIASTSIFFFGYDQGMMGGVNNAEDYIDTMQFGHVATVNGVPNTPVITNSVLQGAIVAIYYIGTLLGSFLGGWFGDEYGRTRAIAFGAAWGTLGASLQCSAQNHDWMICGRAISSQYLSLMGMVLRCLRGEWYC
jgi:MFS family permease